MVGELFFKKIRIAKLGLGFLKKKAGVKLGKLWWNRGTEVLSSHTSIKTLTPSRVFFFRSSPSVASPPGFGLLESLTNMISAYTDHPVMYIKCCALLIASKISSQHLRGW